MGNDIRIRKGSYRIAMQEAASFLEKGARKQLIVDDENVTASL